MEEEELEVAAVRQRWLGTFYFSQADLMISNALGGKAKLENAGIINASNFKWSYSNFWKLTSVNWGSRSIAGFINFAAIGFVGDYISSFYKFNNELYNKLFGGASAGVLATIATTIPNSYADRKVLASQMENGRLLTISPYTMFGQMKSHISKSWTYRSCLDFCKNQLLKRSFNRKSSSSINFWYYFWCRSFNGF